MKILVIADEEAPALWDFYRPGCLSKYDLILSGGDLNAKYLEFLVTMARCPLMYVHGNHDIGYQQNPPGGCDCIDGKLVVYKGVRILGLGGCMKYRPADHQYTEGQMERRIQKLSRAIRMVGGVDIVVSHSSPQGVGDRDDPAHRGFESFLKLIDSYHPQYWVHGHVHMSYGRDIQRVREYGDTKVINCCERYELDLEPTAQLPKLTPMQRFYAKHFVKNLEL